MKKTLGMICLLSFITKAFALTQISVALDWYINPDHAPILAAETQGYFIKNGLAVKLIEPTQTSEVRNLVAANKVTFGIDYEPEVLIAVAKGLPVQMVGSLIPTSLSCITTLQSANITNLKDLQGKTLGFSGDPMNQKFLEVELTAAGLDPASVKLVPIHMDLTQALLSHTVDGVSGMMRNVEPVMLAQMGIKTRLFYPEQYGIPVYNELVFIAKFGANPQTVAAFLKAVGEGARYVKAHPEAAWQAAAKAYPTELASSNKIAATNHAIWLASVPYFNTSPEKINQQAVSQFKDFLLKQGLI